MGNFIYGNFNFVSDFKIITLLSKGAFKRVVLLVPYPCLDSEKYDWREGM